MLLSNYCWVREQQNNTGVAIASKENFYVSLKMASTSFRYSEQSEELEKTHGYLYDNNGFSLIYKDFKELLGDRRLTYIFGPTVSKRYREDLSLESAVENYQNSAAAAGAAPPIKKRRLTTQKRLFSSFEDVEEDEDVEEVERLLSKAVDLSLVPGPSTPPPPLPPSRPSTPPPAQPIPEPSRLSLSPIPVPPVVIEEEEDEASSTTRF